MSYQDPEPSNGHSIFQAIANWVKKYREAIGVRGELVNCAPEQVAEIARDIGVSTEELKFALEKGSHGSDELPRLLRAIGVDPQKLSSTEPALMRSLERICITCGHKEQCQHNLAAGTAVRHYQYYCPNAVGLNAFLS